MTRDEALEIYRQMVLIRRFEERAAQLYVEGKIGGFLHLYIGQEALAVGAMGLLRPDDYFITSYRDHGYALARGTDPRLLMAELFGKATGISRGKGGSMHFYDVPRGNFGGDGIVGGHLPVAAGIGYAIRLRGTDQICLCFFGDGTVNQGAFHEALNVAALWGLPVVFVIENNQYAMGTTLDRASSITDLWKRASGYGMTGQVVDGMDVLAVRTALGEAVGRAREEKRPSLVEVRTYRYRGHSMSDPGKYRTKEEIERAMRDDPIGRFAHWLMDREGLEQAALDALDAEVQAQVEGAVRFAEESPFPSPEALYEDVYVRSPYVNMAAAEKDPAWRAAVQEDRLPEALPPLARAKP